MVEAGAGLARRGRACPPRPTSTARISEAEEADRLGTGRGRCSPPSSTCPSPPTRAAARPPARRSRPARAIINDVTRSRRRPGPGAARGRARAPASSLMAVRAAAARPPAAPAAAVLPSATGPGGGGERSRRSLRIARARPASPTSAIVVDPGIGFFRRRGMAWPEWDCACWRAWPRCARSGGRSASASRASRSSAPWPGEPRSRRPAARLAGRHRGGGAARAPT